MSYETAGALVHSAFVLRHLLCLQKVQLLVYCVEGNDVAAVQLQVRCFVTAGRVWCACGLADCVCIDSALALPGFAAYSLVTTGLTQSRYVRT